MQASSPNRTIGCIGKCTSGLSNEELDRITDNINRTLTHPRGIEIFQKYLEMRDLTDSLDCLALYLTCTKYIQKEMTSPQSQDCLERLAADVAVAKELADEIDGVPQIDMELMRHFNEAIISDSRIAMIEVLQEARDRTRDHLRNIHGSFKRYASEPCPLTK